MSARYAVVLAALLAALPAGLRAQQVLLPSAVRTSPIAAPIPVRGTGALTLGPSLVPMTPSLSSGLPALRPTPSAAGALYSLALPGIRTRSAAFAPVPRNRTLALTPPLQASGYDMRSPRCWRDWRPERARAKPSSGR